MALIESNTEDRPEIIERPAPSWKVLVFPLLLLVVVAIPAMRAASEKPIEPTAAPVAKPIDSAAVALSKPVIAKPIVEGPVFPVASSEVSDVISRFGDSRDGGRRTHLGIDIAAPRGTNVLAVADGKIERVGNEKLGGRVVWLREKGSQRRHYFAHLQTVAVTRGQIVKAGQPIGTVGTTGNASGTRPHLHYAVRVDDDNLDPISLFKTGDAKSSKPDNGRRMRTKVSGAALKATPGGHTIAVLPTNQTVTVQGESGRFYRVRYRGKEGYVARWLLTS